MDDTPWDYLRQGTAKPPIGNGTWFTSLGAAAVVVDAIVDTYALLTINHQAFRAPALRQLAEFCTELADQLEK